ncbi:MAG: hypothetical protein QOI24_2197 [Acidobacteriota bacterium]|jgi:hypothetical protein|nr:hypothetical protein [Acidobacteriota bacterium]
MNELPIPEDVPQATEAAELVRAWVVDGALHCSVSPLAFDNASTWGILLADVARHVAYALQQEGIAKPFDVLDGIRTVFNEELASPTAEPAGEFRTSS